MSNEAGDASEASDASEARFHDARRRRTKMAGKNAPATGHQGVIKSAQTKKRVCLELDDNGWEFSTCGQTQRRSRKLKK